jgi:hypothetical protein
MRLFITPALAAMLTAAGMVGAQAQTYNATGTINVNAKGEGTTTQGKSLRAASSAGDPGYESFSLLDFSGITAPANASSISGFSITMLNYPSSAGYNKSGPLDFFLTGSTTPLTTTEGYTYQSSSTATDGIGTQLGTLSKLGPVSYDATEAQSTLDTFSFTLDAPTKALLLKDLAAGDVQIAMGSSGITTAQFDGLGYGATPTLTLNAGAPVPEASTTASFGLLLVLGLGGVAVARRRKQA